MRRAEGLAGWLALATATPDRLFPRIGIRRGPPEQPRPSIVLSLTQNARRGLSARSALQAHELLAFSGPSADLCTLAPGQLTGYGAAKGEGRDRGIVAGGRGDARGTETGAEKRAATCRAQDAGRPGSALT